MFQSADRPSTAPVADCRALDVPTEASIVGVYDHRIDQSRYSDVERTSVDVRIEGNRPVVLVARTRDTPRLWRVHEKYPGQVAALLLAEPAVSLWPVQVEGLRPEQVFVDAPRLAEWRRSDDPIARKPWKSANLLGGCDEHISTMPLNPNARSNSILERGFDLSVKVWTDRYLDKFYYATSDIKLLISID